MTKKTAYPLTWPQGQPRTLAIHRHSSSFGENYRAHGQSYISRHKISVQGATDRLDKQLQLMGINEAKYILSTNIPLKKDGWPYTRYATLEDVGVAVYFQIDGHPVSPCCDKWDRVEDNIVAIAKHIESLRGQERWGVATLKQAFAGHMALPAPVQMGEHWTSVLNLPADATRDQIKARYRKMAKQHHTDAGGDNTRMTALNVARDQALKEVQ